MRSIDKLREYALTAASVNATTRAVLAGYIDEIEREVNALTDERDLLKTQWEAGVDFDQRLEACADKREDVTLWGVDYTPLPVDADGVPVHVGDVMDSKVDYLFDGRPFEVRAIVLCEDGWEAADGRFGNRYEPNSLRHHHAPTVGDVLREFTRDWCNAACTGDMTDAERDAARANVIAEYAAKLTLRGDE